MSTALAIYLVTAINTWMPPKTTEDETRHQAIADDIAEVVSDPTEKAVFSDDPQKAETGLLVASVAFYESGYAKNVDEGKCYAWQCDKGIAFSMWQIHPQEGVIFDGEYWTYASIKSASWRAEHSKEIITGAVLNSSRKTAAKMGLHMMRQSLRTGTLCIYTGEVDKDTGRCFNYAPKAAMRKDRATKYFKTHPYAP